MTKCCGSSFHQNKDYENKIKKLHSETIKLNKSINSSFDITGGVPDRRFEQINPKFKPFPLDENPANWRLMDFGDGLGEVYAYRWKNDPSQGWISYWAQFDVDANITIDKESTVSSLCKLFAKNGSIILKKTKLITTELWSLGSIMLNEVSLNDCYVYGSVNFNKISISEKNKFYTKDCTLDECSVSGNNLFYQDGKYSGSIILPSGSSISGRCELIGNVQFSKGTTVSGTNRIAGNVFLDKNVSVSGQCYIDSSPSGSISIGKDTTVSGNVTIINSPTIADKNSITDSCFICDTVTIGPECSISGNAVIADECVLVENVTVSGYAICNMKSTIEPGCSVTGHGMVTGSSSLKGGAKVSDYGIVAGSGTIKDGGTVSGQGRVFNGISCPHSVGGSKRHWDNRSCKCQIDTLEDERYNNVPCSPPKYQCPPTVC